MKRVLWSAATALMLATAPMAVMANEAMEQAEAMMEQANELRAKADAMAKEAQAMMDAAKAEAEKTVAAAAQPEAEKEPVETAEAESGDDTPDNIKVAYEEDGKYFTEDDIPTYNVAADGTVDWYAFSGFRRYHSECHVCHGPDGEGSTYAPALKNSALEMDYYDFIDVIVNGRKHIGADANSVMPAFGDNKNVMCYVDDIYVYLKARGTDAIARGRPPKKEKKSDVYRENENACMG
jgi:methanol metabolism-related c-type cytochrome